MKTFVALAMFVAVASAQFNTFSNTQAFPKYTPLAAVAPKPALVKYNPAPVVTKAVDYNHQTGEASAPILKFVSDVSADGFNYAYETGNGIAAQAQGALKSNGKDAVLPHQGSFQWTSPEGLPVAITYIADENGYQPQGAVLPTPPPIPAAILRSLEYISSHHSQEQQKYRL